MQLCLICGRYRGTYVSAKIAFPSHPLHHDNVHSTSLDGVLPASTVVFPMYRQLSFVLSVFFLQTMARRHSSRLSSPQHIASWAWVVDWLPQSTAGILLSCCYLADLCLPQLLAYISGRSLPPTSLEHTEQLTALFLFCH